MSGGSGGVGLLIGSCNLLDLAILVVINQPFSFPFRIMQQSEQNKMTSDNISTCWWPSMLHPRSQSFDDLAIEAQLANIFRLLIERTDFFFGEAVQEEEMVEDGDTQALLSNQMEGMGEELR